MTMHQAWQEAERAMPAGWQLMGVVRGPPGVDRSHTWGAWAVGPNGERVQAGGDTPEDALLQLVSQLGRQR